MASNGTKVSFQFENGSASTTQKTYPFIYGPFGSHKPKKPGYPGGNDFIDEASMAGAMESDKSGNFIGVLMCIAIAIGVVSIWLVWKRAGRVEQQLEEEDDSLLEAERVSSVELPSEVEDAPAAPEPSTSAVV